MMNSANSTHWTFCRPANRYQLYEHLTEKFIERQIIATCQAELAEAVYHRGVAADENTIPVAAVLLSPSAHPPQTRQIHRDREAS
jgi:hypothetical protein